MYRIVLGWLVCSLIGIMGCEQSEKSNNIQEASLSPPNISSSKKIRAKFEPEDGKVLVFIGQELTAIGGLEKYNDGYLDHFDRRPAGFTAYSFLTPGDTTFGFVHKGLDGITSTDNWGDNDSNMSLQLNDPDYANMCLAIGLGMVGHEDKVANGVHDEMIKELGAFLQSIAPRPVFLRIGYEFDGHPWNHYEKENYLKAYRRVKDIMDNMGVENVAFVWQSTGFVSTPDQLEEWYPGDDYVDWCSFSFFARWREQEMIEFAKKKGKPVFIAEASASVSGPNMKFDNLTLPMDFNNPEDAQLAWDKWFTPFFKTIHNHPKTVKAISYINCNWKAHPMWKDNPTFKGIDARLQENKELKEKWEKEISKSNYVMSSPTLYSDLQKSL
ncbi:glycoside hydrolase family 26 protein [Flammeovirga sp. MY04]|uniref:glycoside hydrolase family 26 protein n=1 Tax=Flammeovirga sp. MY04 TaxID=1191459 RepID=UPI0008062ED6|nr:glycosyl hydrolase [Flammeovirga sp. MY04]